MKVSVQIPTYNQERFIQKAIESALAQDYADLEIVVSDDCSTDGTYEAAKQLAGDKVKVVRNEQNMGRVKNYHKLLYELTTGDYIVNLDGDDHFCDNSFISRGMAQMREHNVLFYQSCIMSEGEGTSFKFRHKLLGEKQEGKIDGRSYFKHFHKNEFFGHLSTIYNAEKARAIGFYQHDVITSDSESMLKLALHGTLYLDNRITGVWNIHSANESRSMLFKNDAIVAAFGRLRDYAVPFIGEQAANEWYTDAVDINKRSFAELKAKHDFPGFLRDSKVSDYINTDFWKLVVKKTIGRI